MIEEGVVSRLNGPKIVINIARHTACSACRLCSGHEKKIMQLEAENSIKARPGDRVFLRLDDGVILKGALIIYMLPSGFLLAGLFLGNFLIGEAAGAGMGIAFLIASLLAIKKFNLIDKNEFKPVVTLKI